MDYTLNSMFGMEGKVIVVTGGSKGIGGEVVTALAHLGAKPIIISSTDAGAAKAEKLRAEGYFCDAFRCDVTIEEEVASAGEYVRKTYGRLDGLVNCAGITYVQDCREFDMSKFHRVMDINVIGTMHCVKVFSRMMVDQGKGRIVNTSSIRGFQGRVNASAYAASKGAINNLTHSLAVELGPKGVTVNAIAPGFVLTDINRDALEDLEYYEWIMSRCPMKRLAKLEEMVGLVIFYLSDCASFVNGTVTLVDGGWVAG